MSSMDNFCVNALRVVSAQEITKAKSGHPGIALGAAPILHTLFTKHLNVNVEDQKWYNFKGELFLFIAGLLATFIRFVGSSASSMIVYGLGFKEALAYNAIYIPLSGAAAIAVIMGAYGPLLRVHHRFPVRKSLQ